MEVDNIEQIIVAPNYKQAVFLSNTNNFAIYAI